MLGILKSEVTGNLADRAGGEKQPFLCGADDFVLYPFQSCLPRFFLNQVAEVVGRKAKFAQVFHDGPGLAGGEVAALIEGNAAPRQLGIERTAAVNPGSETTDVNNGFYNGKQRLKAIIIIAKKTFLVLSTISLHYQQVTSTVTGAVQTL